MQDGGLRGVGLADPDDPQLVAFQVERAAEAAGPVDLARFAEEPWVWLRRDASPDYHDQLMATCHQAGFTPDVRGGCI
jgi:hypothetical protein